MTERPFLDKALPPTEPALQAALGRMYPHYQEVLGLASAYSQAWAYAKSSGWMLKLFDRQKALLYLIPLNAGFKISLTLREQERAACLADDALSSLRDKLSAAKKYTEGFAVQFDVAGPKDFHRLEVFLRKLVALRG